MLAVDIYQKLLYTYPRTPQLSRLCSRPSEQRNDIR